MNKFEDKGKSVAKWDSKLRKYLPFAVHKDASFYEEDMDKVIKCANCATDISYGACYTSRTIHTSMGLAYMVCPKCYSEEVRYEFDITRK